MMHILNIGSDPTLERMGGKGFALARLSHGDFPVPSWLMIPPPEFLLDETSPEESLRHFEFPPEFIQDLEKELSKLGSDDCLFAVRSSAIEEDGSETSFAGQLDSYLNIQPSNVSQYILRVWQSAFGERIRAYREENQMNTDIRLPAVVVQRMINPDFAGVAFSVDAINGNWSTALVSAVPGLGEKLVSGQANADTWRVHRDGSITDFTTSNSSGTLTLSENQVHAVANLARRCERFFGCPQDIEWAWAGNQLHLLQSRPITTLHRTADPEGVLNIWDNSNIAESYGGVTTPLTFSFAHYIYKEVYQQFCLIMHVSPAVVAENRSIFNGMLGLIRGRVYYNLMSWYRMLALLPGFRLNHKFMEQMMGVKEGMPESVLADIEKAHTSRTRDALRLIWAIFGLLKAQLCLPKMIRKFYSHFDQSLESIERPLEDLRADELAEHFHTLEQRLLSQWNAPLVNDFFAMIYFGVLRGLTRKWCRDEDGTLQNGLLCGTGNIVSAEPAQRIHEMAKVAESHPELIEILMSAKVHQIHRSMHAVPEFEALYHAYLERFADRCLNELKLESPTLKEDPLPLLRSIGSLAKRMREGHTIHKGAEKQLQQSAETEIRKHLTGHPFRKLLFRYVLKQARSRVRDRENLRFERTRLFGRIRAIFFELGKRFFAIHTINHPRDIVYLEIYEILGFVEGTATTTDLKGLIELRKKEYAGFSHIAPPADRFETRGIVHIGNTYQPASIRETASPTGDTLKGIGCCPGIVQGKARVVRNPVDAEIQPGEILVAEQTDPGWITLFPTSSAVLVERGSLLSHSAIVSREMGIPAIVSIQNLLQTIRTGDLIEMDGTAGTIRILESNEV